MMRIFRLLGIGVLLWGGGACCAYADIYAYTDAGGNVSYSNVPTDSRYVVMLKEPPNPLLLPKSSRDGASMQLRAAAYAQLIEDTARGASLHPALLRAVIEVESAFDPQAVSPKGAIGLMQLLPSTAQRYGVKQPFDPAENMRGGARYLGDLMKRYGNHLELVLAAYNAGEDAVDRYGRRVPPFAETQAYVPSVMKLYRKFLSGSRLAAYPGTLPPPT